MSKTDKITIKQLQDAMLDVEKPLHPRYIYRLSDLGQEELAALQKTWPNVPAWRRQAIMEDIEEIGSSDYVLSFEAIARYGLKDSESRVRELAVRILMEYELPDLVPTYLRMLETESDESVRAVAASALGQYIYLGEIEELPESTLRKIEEKLLQVSSGQDTTLVRRRALEALGYSSREEVPALIEAAYHSDKNEWLASALYAMGRSANKVWNDSVLSELGSDSPEVLTEAVRAAGELEIKKSLPRLARLLEAEDADVRWAAIWSLSQIGGEGVRERLENLYEQTDDEDEADFIESALDNLDFTEDVQLFELMDVSEEDEDDEDFLDLTVDDEEQED